MFDGLKELAALICHGDAVLNPKKWLAEEASDLATRILYLDEIPSQAILPLAKLVANGESDARNLAQTLGMDEAKIEEYLNALCEFKFAEETCSGYRATPSGQQVLRAIGQKMVARELFQIKARLQQLQQLHQYLNDS